MAKANELKRGMVILLNGKILLIKSIDVQTPSARGASTLYKIRFSDVKTGLKVEERFKGDDLVETIELLRKPVDLSYISQDEYVFMDKNDYSQFSIKKSQIEEELKFIPPEGLDGMQLLMLEDEVLALELPQTVELEIIETAPELKGASATSRTKPATLSTGLTLPVPEYLKTGDKIRVHVEEQRYMGRAD